MVNPTRDRTLWGALVVFVVAVAARAAYLAVSEHPVFIPRLDGVIGWEAARDLRSGLRPSFALAGSSAPGHIAWLAFWQALVGERVLWHQVVGVVLGALRCVLLYLGARRLGAGPLAACLAGLLAALLPSAIYFDTSLLKAGLGTTLLAAAVCIAVGEPPAEPRRQLGRGASLGLLGALSSLVQLADALTALALILAGARSRRALAAGLGVFVLALLPLFAWQRLAAVDAPFLPRSGYDLAAGQQGMHRRCPDPALFCPHPQIPADPVAHAFETRLLAEAIQRRPLTPAESDAHWRGEAVRRVLADPLAALALAAGKLGAVIRDHEAKDIDYLPSVAWLGKVPFGFGVLFCLGLAGVVVLPRDRRVWTLLAVIAGGTATCVIGYVTMRLRFPLVVPLTLLAAVALQAAPRLRPLRLGLVSVVLLLAALLSFRPPSPAAVRYMRLRAAHNVIGANARGLPEPALFLDGYGHHREAAFVAAARAHVSAEAAALSLRYLLWQRRDAEARRLFASLGEGERQRAFMLLPAGAQDKLRSHP